jgi:hypothetical protein
MKKILEWFNGGLVTEVSNTIDKLFTSDEERLKAKNEMLKVLKEQQIELQRLQTTIIIEEAKGNWLQRSWRPIIMLAFAFIVIYVKFLAPVFGLDTPPLENEFWDLLQLGIGGYVIGRTGEKIAKEYSSTKK